MTTKEKILNKALTLFSSKGFEAVSVKEIAADVGIKDSSLYKHFKSKQEIFDTILEECCHRSSSYFEKYGISEDLDEDTLSKLKRLSNEDFIEIALGLFEQFLFDDYIIEFRKILTIEQYNCSKMSELFQMIFMDSIMNYLKQMFQMFIDDGIFIEEDVNFLADEFYAPVFMMYYQLDTNQNSEKNLREYLKKHFMKFIETYTKK